MVGKFLFDKMMKIIEENRYIERKTDILNQKHFKKIEKSLLKTNKRFENEILILLRQIIDIKDSIKLKKRFNEIETGKVKTKTEKEFRLFMDVDKRLKELEQMAFKMITGEEIENLLYDIDPKLEQEYVDLMSD